MHPKFGEHIRSTVELFNKLQRCEPCGFTDVVPPLPGVYAFLEGTIVERVGRTSNLKNRLRSHLRKDHNSAAYAFKRARDRLGLKATYRKGTGRADLQREPEFSSIFAEEIARLRRLSVKFIVVESMPDQYLLELYASIAYGLSLDEFGNH